MENKDLIGKKVKGFKFESASILHNWNPEMEKYIDKLGKITYYLSDTDMFKIKFEDSSWYYPAELVEKHLMEMESLLGKKVKGFKFKSCEKDGLFYSYDMDNYIGKIGTISKYNETYNSYRVDFRNESWSYPAALIEKYLVENEKQNEMKTTIELLESIDIDKLAEYSAKEVTDAIVDFPLRDMYKEFFKEGFNKAIELIKQQ